MNPNDDSVTILVLLLHAGSTLMMTGLIWFVQIVHYPLMSRVGESSFAKYESAHTRSTTWVVGPLMLIELVTAVYLLGFAPTQQAHWVALLGLIALGFIWGSTLMLQIPAHRRLERGFDQSIHRELVQTNWVRTIAWSIRSILAMWLLVPAGVIQ